MLTAQRESDGRKTGAWEAERGEGPFVCFCCRRIVTLKKGRILAPHFAHQPPVNCEYGSGESEEHRRAKISIYESLARDPLVTKCEMERDLGTVRPDVSAYVGAVPVAIEVQLSTLSLEKIVYRSAEYARKGVYVLWLPIYQEALRRSLYDPRPWEQWLQSAYGGRVYYWLEGLSIRPIHFRDYYTLRRGRTRDYQKLSGRKVPINGREVVLTRDFAAVRTEGGRRGAWSFPSMKLFVDTQPDWYMDLPAAARRVKTA